MDIQLLKLMTAVPLMLLVPSLPTFSASQYSLESLIVPALWLSVPRLLELLGTRKLPPPDLVNVPPVMLKVPLPP